MEVKRLINLIILAIATAVFLYQCGTAILKLNAQQTITISETIDIGDPRIRQPIITVCMVNQYKGQYVDDDLDFQTFSHLNMHRLYDYNDSTISFGKHLNITYEKLMKTFSKYSFNFDGFYQKKRKKYDETFFQSYGYCSELADYDLEELLTIAFINEKNEKYNIFVTDSRLKTFLGPDLISQSGDRIEVYNDIDYKFTVKLKLEDLTNPYTNENCLPDEEEIEMYKDCVDNELTNDLLPDLGCIPPWLSANNQCDGIYEESSKLGQSFYEGGLVYENYSLPSIYHDQNKAQQKCKKPCLKTTIQVERKQKGEPRDNNHYFVDLRFITEIVLKRKIVAYDMFNFVVDVGSSLGLWLGLSILNITDCIINFVYNLDLEKLLYK